MPENIHDKGYKRILAKKKNFLSLLKSFINEAWVSEISEGNLQLIDKEFILKDFKEREADIIYKIKFRGKEVIFYCLIELQSTVDYTMPFRLLIYMTELWQRHFGDIDEASRERLDFRLPAIIPVVLYNGRGEWTAVRSFKEYLSGYENFGGKTVDFEYILFNINKYNDEILKEIGNLISSVFLLDKSKNSEQLINNIKFVAKILTKLEADERIDLMNWLRDVLLVKMKESNNGLVYEAITSLERGDVAHMTYAIERILDEAEEKGIEKGIEKRNIELARDMLIGGEPIETIIKWTKLSLNKIMELQKEIK